MAEEAFTFALPEVVKFEDCARLHDFLTGHDTNPVTIDASAVTRLHSLAAQLILAAVTARPEMVTLASPSAAFCNACDTLGLSQLAADAEAAA